MEDIKQIIEEILIYHKMPYTKIKTIIKTGSQIIRENPNDLDFVVVVEGLHTDQVKRSRVLPDVTYDVRFMTESFYNKALLFESDYYYISKFNFFKDKNVIEIIYNDGDNINTFDMFKEGVKEKYLELLINDYNNVVNSVINPETNYSKWYVYAYIILKMYDNESSVITEEMKSNSNKIYNKQDNYLELCQWVSSEIERYRETLTVNVEE